MYSPPKRFEVSNFCRQSCPLSADLLNCTFTNYVIGFWLKLFKNFNIRFGYFNNSTIIYYKINKNYNKNEKEFYTTHQLANIITILTTLLEVGGDHLSEKREYDLRDLQVCNNLPNPMEMEGPCPGVFYGRLRSVPGHVSFTTVIYPSSLFLVSVWSASR